MAKTSVTAVVDAIASISAGAMRVGTEYSLSDSYAHTLGIYLVPVTGVTGAKIVIQLKMGTNKFIDHQTIQLGTISVPVDDTLNGTVSAADTTVTLTTGGTAIDDIAELWFIDLDTNPEICRTKSISGKIITLVDPLLLDHANGSLIYAGVEEWTYELPLEATACRIIYVDEDATHQIFAGADITKVTSV